MTGTLTRVTGTLTVGTEITEVPVRVPVTPRGVPGLSGRLKVAISLGDEKLTHFDRA